MFNSRRLVSKISFEESLIRYNRREFNFYGSPTKVDTSKNFFRKVYLTES